MTGRAEIERQRAAGFSEAEVMDYVRGEAAKATAAGFSAKEVEDYYLGVGPDTNKANKGLADTVWNHIKKMTKPVEAILNVSAAPLETVLHAASGIAGGFPAYLGGGVGQLFNRAIGASDEDPKVVAQRFSEFVTYKPITEAGQSLTDVVMWPFAKLMEASEAAGKKVVDVTGSPVVAAITEATIQTLPIPVVSSLGRRLAGKVPTRDDVRTSAEVIAGEGAARIEPKLRETYEKSGVDPQAVADAARNDPTILQDLASDNRAAPETIVGRPPPPGPPAPKPPAVEEPPAGDTVRSHIVSEPEAPRRTVKEFLDHWYTRIWDDRYPIPGTKEAAKIGVKFEGGIGPREALRLTAGTAGKAEHFIENGTFNPITYKTNGPSLRSVLEMAGDDVRAFEDYLVAKHSIEREAAGKPTGLEKTIDRDAIIKDGDKRFAKASQEFQRYKDALVDYAVDAGIIPTESVAAWREAYKNHVPFYRFFEEGRSGGGGTSPRNPVKAAKGSERKIIDPIISVINDTYTFIQLAEHNMARQKMLALPEGMIKRVPDPVRPIKLTEPEIQKMFDEFVTTVKKTSTKTSTTTTSTTTSGTATPEAGSKVFEANKKRVMDALEARGFSANESEIMLKRIQMAGKDAGNVASAITKEIQKTEYVPELNIRVDNKVATIFRSFKMPVGKDEIVIMRDGKREVYKVGPEVAEAYNGLDAGSSDLLTGMARVLRAGVTIDPGFMGRNIARDAVSAFVFAGSHPLKTVRGGISYFKEDVAYQNWLKGGGANSAMLSLDRNYLESKLGLAKLEADTGLMSKTWNVVKSPVEALRIIGEVTENVTRIGSVVDEMKVAKSKAQIQALSLIAREATVDFARHGSDPFLQSIARRTAFLNPTLQGMDRLARGTINDPAGVTMKALAAITVPSVLLWYANHDDQWTDPQTGIVHNRWNETPAWQRDLFWIVLTDKHTYRIPKPFEMGVIFGSVPERALDAYFTEKPEAFKHLGKSVADVFTFNVTPTALIPPVQQMTNFNFFTDRPLISSTMEKLLPEYQYSPYTTEATKAIARTIGAIPGMHTSSFASPTVIDNYIRGWTGTLGDYVLQTADLALRKTGVLPDPVRPTKKLEDMPVIKAFTIRFPSSSAQSIQDFYDAHEKSKKVTDTISYLARIGDAKSIEAEAKLNPAALIKMDGVRDALGKAQNTIMLVDRNESLTPDEKRQLIDTMYSQMIMMANAGNEGLREIKKATEGINLQ